MEIRITADSVEISGYVNAIERDSRVLHSRIGKFVERVCKGAFKNAIKRNDDIHILLNHQESRYLGSTKQGNLDLCEDAIGLKARAIIRDSEVIEKARKNELVGWSFGFCDREVESKIVDGLTHRAIRELDLMEVSILDKTKLPAYEGTLISARSGDTDGVQYRGVDFIDEIIIRDDTAKTGGIEKESTETPGNSDVKKELGKEYFTNLWEQIKKMEVD